MKRLVITFALFATLAPAVVGAASLLNPIWDGRYAVTCNVGNAPCTFCDLLKVGANIIDALTLLVIPIAAAIIVYGGFRIMTAGSSPAGLSAGKEAMKWAGIGIAVALSGWLIVNTVFSLLSGGSLTAIECPTGEIITPVPYEPAGGDCSSLNLTITDGGSGIGKIESTAAWPSGRFPLRCDAATRQKVDANLQKTTDGVNEVRGYTENNTVEVTSMFRPFSYQEHLYDVFTKKKRINDYPSLKTNCSAEAQVVQQEFDGHGLGSTVSRPGYSPHGAGYGVDIKIGTCGNGNKFTTVCRAYYRMVDEKLDAAGGLLDWQEIGGDEVHFNLRAPERNSGC